MYGFKRSVIGVLLLSFFGACSSVEHKRTPTSIETAMELVSPFNVLIWNSYKGSDSQFANDLSSMLPSYELVLLQEAQENNLFKDLLENQESFKTSFSKSWGKNGVLTASRASILSSTPLRSNVREFYFTTPKSALVTLHPLRDDQGELHQLLVINLHMINFRETHAVRAQLEEYTPFLRAHQGPILVGGDFNTWNSYRTQAVEDYFKQFNLIEIDYRDEDNRDARSKLVVGVLDRVYQRGLEVIETKVYEEINSSDHYPFSAKLRVIPAKEP